MGWIGTRGSPMENGIQPKQHSGEDSVHFRSEDSSGSDAFRLNLLLVLAVFSLAYILSGRIDGLLELGVWVFCLVFCTYLIADSIYGIVKAKGKGLRGVLVDGDGILDRSSWVSVGRVYWHEIKTIYPINPSFFGIPLPRQVIGLDVRDGFLLRRSARIRFKVWLNRKVFRTPDIQLSSGKLRKSRTQVLFVLQEGLRQYELRSISEAKELDPGG